MVHHQYLSLAQAQAILFRSFLLSQESARLQALLFTYVARTHPTWRIAEEDVSHVKASTGQACRQFLAHGWHEPGDHKISEEIDTQWSQQVQQLNTPQDAPLEEDRQLLLMDILAELLTRDYLYLVARGGRPRLNQEQGEERHQHTPRGRFFSHFCQYGLLGKPTGLAVFDALFTEIKALFEGLEPAIQHALRQGDVRQHVMLILERHNQHYPDQPLAMPRPGGM